MILTRTAYMGTINNMKLTLQIQVLPSTDQSAALRATVERFNEAANWLAGFAFEAHTANKIELQHRHYRELREQFGLSAQMAVRCIARVCEAYKRDKAIRPTFRPHAAMPFDHRMMSFKGVDRVSLLTLTGRIIAPIVMGSYQQEQFTNAKGQAELVLRDDGKWFLLVTVDIPDGAPLPVTDFIGVDLGVANIATTSDGEQFSGEVVEKIRLSYHRTRRSLAKKMSRSHKRGTRRNARRAMKRIGNREQRFRRHVSHCISKQIVARAKDTGRGLAIEDLAGIRERTRFRKAQRAKMGGWAFAQLRAFLTYKAQLNGVLLVTVDPRNTSRTCSVCGYCDKANRPSQDRFLCLSCGYESHADKNAAVNISVAGAAVSRPEGSEPSRLSIAA